MRQASSFSEWAGGSWRGALLLLARSDTARAAHPQRRCPTAPLCAGARLSRSTRASHCMPARSGRPAPGADPAVLVVFSVALALLATGAAYRHARLNRCPNDGALGRRLAGHDAAGGVAHVGAVEAQANAAHQLRHVALAEEPVASAQLVDTAAQSMHASTQRTITSRSPLAGGCGLGLEHLSNRHLGSSRVAGGKRRMRQVTSLVQPVVLPCTWPTYARRGPAPPRSAKTEKDPPPAGLLTPAVVPAMRRTSCWPKPRPASRWGP